ncbi:hypothetical protein PIIN_01869 [Serendipita indica DSM 11827]|uniref:Uncharacterized protein n=1 Tax=Serendipita indica (strain DSM 11827) TaxID=1109443 RepID=G4T9K9_SERID|nr:hypothetical protein PIIN_01869 [Serendipita indica DSM 11827]
MLDLMNSTWELGLASISLLELEEADLSVFGRDPFNTTHTQTRNLSPNSTVVQIANAVMSSRPPSIQPLAVDGSAGDPASLGVAVMLASRARRNDPEYAQAAAAQLHFLARGGTTSAEWGNQHACRSSPAVERLCVHGSTFIAFHGAMNENVTELQEAKRQAGFYRDALRDSETKLWRHIVLGMGLAAAGMVRIAQTMAKSRFASQLAQDTKEMVEWTRELVGACWQYQTPSGALFNHPLNEDFIDSSWTALLASATYRLAVLDGNKTHIARADSAADYVAAHIDGDGELHQVVNGTNWNFPQAEKSAQAQAFVLLMQAARRDYGTWESGGGQPILGTLV